MSNSLQPPRLQHTRLPCPSPTPGVYSDSCPLSQWCHPTISSSVIPFFSCPQSFPASGSFQMSQLFTSGGQSIGVSDSASVLPMNTQDWSPLGWTGWISLQSNRTLKSLLQHHSSKASILWCSAFFIVQLSHPYMTAAAAAKSRQSCPTLCDPVDGSPFRLHRSWDSPGKKTGAGCHFLLQCMKVKSESEVAQSCPTLRDPTDCSPPGSFVHGIFQARALECGATAFSNTWLLENKQTNIALTRQTFVDKVMSLLFNMLSRLVITFLPRSKRLLISWLQSPTAVI